MCAEMCPCRQREVHRRSTSRKGECTPSGYVNSVPSRRTSPLTVERRCICRLQMNIVRRLRFQVSSEKHSLVFLMCCALKAFAYLKTAAVRRNLKEPADGNACVSAWWANAALERLRTRQRFYRGDSRGVAAFSYVQKNARSAVEAAEFTWRILRLV